VKPEVGKLKGGFPICDERNAIALEDLNRCRSLILHSESPAAWTVPVSKRGRPAFEQGVSMPRNAGFAS